MIFVIVGIIALVGVVLLVLHEWAKRRDDHDAQRWALMDGETADVVIHGASMKLYGLMVADQSARQNTVLQVTKSHCTANTMMWRDESTCDCNAFDGHGAIHKKDCPNSPFYTVDRSPDYKITEATGDCRCVGQFHQPECVYSPVNEGLTVDGSPDYTVDNDSDIVVLRSPQYFLFDPNHFPFRVTEQVFNLSEWVRARSRV